MRQTTRIAEQAVAVTGWLRRHPDVEAGPSVRASLALAELVDAWRAVTGGDGGLLPAALVTLPHRLRVRPGVDPDELVRQAVARIESLEGGGEADPEDAGGRGHRPPAGEPQLADVTVGIVPAGHRPDAGDGRDDRFVFPAEEARRLLDDLLAPGPPDPPTAGPAPTLPARRGGGEEILFTRPFRAGDRYRDLSVRQTVRASVRRGATADGGGLDLTAVTRRSDAPYDVVIVLDVSASMGASERPLVAPATTAIAAALVQAGHRVGAIVFSEEAVVARPLSRSAVPLETGGYPFAHATSVEAGIDAGREVLARHGASGARRHLVLVTDAETTSHGGSDDAWGPSGAPRAMAGMARLLNGGMVAAARRAALLAASRCRRQGVVLSVVYPDERSDVTFAHAMAAAGGGRARVLRAEN